MAVLLNEGTKARGKLELFNPIKIDVNVPSSFQPGKF